MADKRRDPLAIALLGASVLYPLLFLDRGWIPHDDGMLGQAALRVLTGELPHRDFHDVYTGALSYWHALSFVAFGINLMAPRILLFVSYAGFVAAFYGVARRFAPDRGAALVVLLAAVWGLPNYPAAMPTWYNLFLAVVGLWCLIRHVETDHRRWLVAAGVACGVSVIIKIVGLYTLAAFLMVLAMAEARSQQGSPEGSSGAAGDPATSTGIGYPTLLAAGLGVYLALIVWLVRASPDAVTVVHFVVPSAAVAALTVWRAHATRGRRGDSERVRHFATSALVFGCGLAIPLAIFAAPYIVTGSVGDLALGTLVLPFRRLSFAATAPLPLGLFLPSLPVVALLGVATLGPKRTGMGATLVLGIVLAAVLIRGGGARMYPAVWGGLLLTPVLATLGAGAAAVGAWRRSDDDLALKGAAVAAVLATFTLVQYPFSGPVYFFYLAPLVALAALVPVGLRGVRWKTPMAALLLFGIAYGTIWVGRADLYPTAQGRYVRRPPHERLRMERGGIRVPGSERAEYERLAAVLVELSGGTGVAFVTPDAPEAYFLSGLRNPTPVFYDFLDEPEGRSARILETLEREDVRVVALNRAPQFSGPPADDLISAIESRYPQATAVGRFVVRWR